MAYRQDDKQWPGFKAGHEFPESHHDNGKCIRINVGTSGGDNTRLKSTTRSLDLESETQLHQRARRHSIATILHRPIKLMQKRVSSSFRSSSESALSQSQQSLGGDYLSSKCTKQDNSVVICRTPCQPSAGLMYPFPVKSCDGPEETLLVPESAGNHVSRQKHPLDRSTRLGHTLSPTKENGGMLTDDPTPTTPITKSTPPISRTVSLLTPEMSSTVIIGDILENKKLGDNAAGHGTASDFDIKRSAQSPSIPEYQGQNLTIESLPTNSNAVVAHSRHESEAFKAQWGYIQRMRLDIWSLRSRVHGARNALRQKQAEKSDADDRYMMRVHADELGISLPGASPPLPELRQRCRETRDQYGPLEDDCIELENHLSNEEFQLTRAEEQFYARWHYSRSPEFRPSSPRLEGNSQISYHGLDIEETIPSYHPLVTDYLSKLGDVELLRERLEEFLDEKQALEHEEKLRRTFNMSLNPEDQAWLYDSETMHKNIREELHQTEIEHSQLKSHCMAEGLIDESGEPVPFQDLEKVQFQYEDDLDAEDRKSEYVRFPLLLPVHGADSLGQESMSYSPHMDQYSATRNRRINEWILRNLRSSPLEVHMLADIQRDTRNDDNDWQLQVLSEWFRDETNYLGEGQKVPSYAMSATAQTNIHSDSSRSSTGSGLTGYLDSGAVSGGTEETEIAFPHYDQSPQNELYFCHTDLHNSFPFLP